MIDFEAVGNQINSKRLEFKYSQDELAEKLYVSRQAVSRWERGQSMPTIDNIIELSKMFQISIEELLCMEDEIVVDSHNIFEGHNRKFILKGIINGKIKVDLFQVFGQFTGDERMILLKAIKNGKIDEIFMKSLVNGKDYVEIAPFVDDEVWSMVADKYLANEVDINIVSLFPFMDDETLNRICDEVIKGNCQKINIDTMLPFLDDDKINDAFVKAVKDWKDYEKFFPFITEDALHDYVMAYINGEEVALDFDKAYPYMSNEDIKLIFKYELNREDQK